MFNGKIILYWAGSKARLQEAVLHSILPEE
jgi:hypothetical protein